MMRVAKRRIGLLGGSFNPAHEGHVHISLEALKRARLDEIWWLVSPQNPLKKGDDLAPYGKRIKAARALAGPHRRIRVSDIERVIGTRYTVDTLKGLKRRFPHTHFVWVMGADNLASFHRWKRWATIFSNNNILVMDRAPYAHTSLRSKAAIRFMRFRCLPAALILEKPPGWAYVHMRLNPLSSTAIRTKTGF